MNKYCSGCKQDLSVSNFGPNKCKFDKLSPYCRDCDRRSKIEVANLKKLHPKPDACECCGSNKNRLTLDHDHDTREYRGWICIKCNTGIGMLGDNLEGIRMAEKYLLRG
jgi:hypothetical protein